MYQNAKYFLLPFQDGYFSNIALAKINGNLHAITSKSEKERQLSRAITLEREPSKKKQRTDTKKYAKRIKSDNFTRGNSEQSNIAIARLDLNE
jgi:hypothetical protein